MESQSWRLIDTGPMQGPNNMAVDESIFNSFSHKSSIPILRIYGWNPPSISLGRFQNADEVLDLERCRKDFLPVIRRISGGGVIYHAEELTYSIVCSSEQVSLIAFSVKESFRILTGFLIEFYRSFNLDANYAVDTDSYDERLGLRTAYCFAGKESFDILINGKKIGGNAQRRNKNLIFQHGSIPIVNMANAGFEYMKDRSQENYKGTTSLSDCGVCLDLDSLKFRLLQAFKRCMCVDFIEDQLSNEELFVCEKLLVEKYATDSWNLRGEVA